MNNFKIMINAAYVTFSAVKIVILKYPFNLLCMFYSYLELLCPTF